EVEAARTVIDRRLMTEPLRTARRINDALTRLRAHTTADDILQAIPEQLCAAAGFDRAIVSRVDGSTWVPRYWHATGRVAEDTALASFLRDARITLTNGMIETEVVPRR